MNSKKYNSTNINIPNGTANIFSKGRPRKPEPTKSASPVQAGVEDAIHVEYRNLKRKSKFWEVLFGRLAHQV